MNNEINTCNRVGPMELNLCPNQASGLGSGRAKPRWAQAWPENNWVINLTARPRALFCLSMYQKKNCISPSSLEPTQAHYQQTLQRMFVLALPNPYVWKDQEDIRAWNWSKHEIFPVKSLCYLKSRLLVVSCFTKCRSIVFQKRWLMPLASCSFMERD